MSDDIRPAERRIEVAEADDARLRFIGTIRTPWIERKDCPRQGSSDGAECQVTVFAPWGEALAGLEAYRRIELLYWLDQARRDLVVQNPGHDGKLFGTFALRSPVRPNPIGTSVVELVRIEGDTLVVRGLDCLDGTPLLDIKPERGAFTPKAPPKPGV